MPVTMPFAAPEVWRLLAPKKLPSNRAALQYPGPSKYQLAILYFEYRKNMPAGAPATL